MALRRGLGVWLAALLIGACGSGDPIPLDTAPQDPPAGCYLSYGQGELIEDPTSGTAVRQSGSAIYDLTWPTGYTATRSGDTIEVRNRKGEVVAATGHWYRFFGASWGDPPGPVHVTGDSGCIIEITPDGELMGEPSG
jgi:hypothetical protein